jgi:hypothetical protein
MLIGPFALNNQLICYFLCVYPHTHTQHTKSIFFFCTFRTTCMVRNIDPASLYNKKEILFEDEFLTSSLKLYIERKIDARLTKDSFIVDFWDIGNNHIEGTPLINWWGKFHRLNNLLHLRKLPTKGIKDYVASL